MADLLQVKNLQTSFFTPEGEVRAIDGVSFEIGEGKTLGLVGESGCGKSVTSLSIMRLIQSPPGKIVGGEIIYRGRDLLQAQQRADAQNPRQRDLDDLSGADDLAQSGLYRRQSDRRGDQACTKDWANEKPAQKTIEMLRLVKIADPESRVDSYPHQLSGGMRQRVMIAMALSCNPSLLIADEPTTALDVTIQAQILELMKELQQKIGGMALLLITHDLGVVAEQADEVAIMYAGKIVERANTKAIFSRPFHPYTVGLLNSLPGAGGQKKKRLDAIPGVVPNPLHLPSGCRFRDRCPRAADLCAQVEPPLEEKEAGHPAACHFRTRRRGNSRGSKHEKLPDGRFSIFTLN